MIFALVVAFMAGVLRTVTRSVNAQLAQRIGPLQSTFYNYVGGLVCSVVAIIVSQESVAGAVLSMGQSPAWAYLGGAIGVLFVVLSNITTPKVSAYSMTLLIFVGQIATGVALDALLESRLSLGKIAGGILILGGLLGNLSTATASFSRR